MASPMNSAEPSIDFRQSLNADPRNSVGNSYQTLPTPPVVSSVNSTNAGAFTAPTVDDSPLLQADAFRNVGGPSPSVWTFRRKDGLGTFAGVFAPVALSIWSIMLFLRMGYIIGQAGVLVTVGMLFLAYFILLCTVLSLCAVSTNGAVETGGVYYMISRALGPEFGGSIGVLFFFANVFSCGLYIAGFREALTSNFGPGGLIVADQISADRWWDFCYDFFTAVFILGLCLVGSSVFGRASVVVLCVLGISYMSFLISLMVWTGGRQIPIPRTNSLAYKNAGAHGGTNDTNVTLTVYGNYTGVRSETFQRNVDQHYVVDFSTGRRPDFAVVFGVLFSGVTGIMAGANMSGELRNPQRSIPAGTLTALLVTFVVYFITTFLLGASCDTFLLQNDYVVVQAINGWPPLIAIGLFATTLFAAMSNMMGASRVLFRLAEDRLFGFILSPAAKTFCRGNPVVAVVISWVLVVCVLLMGTLNRIAQITSTFFLFSYAGVNLACLALELTSAPNFRPHFQFFSWHTALLGFIGCISMMFVISAQSAGIAIILVMLMLIGLHYKSPAASWGSISQALIFHQVRKYLLLLDSRKDHVKFWRPQVLLLVSNPKSCTPLIDFVNDLKKSGLYMLGHVKVGRFDACQMDPCIEDFPYWLGLIDHLRVKAFVELTLAPSVREGAQHLVVLGESWLCRMAGLGALKPNTVILGFYDSAPPTDTLAKRWTTQQRKKFAKLERGDIEEKFADLRTSMSRSISPVDYVGMLRDVLRMNKNLCLARNFSEFDKSAVFSGGFGGHKQFIDVWPVDFVKPTGGSTASGDGFDNSCLFLLQLACILNMVSGWKSRTVVRVFLCVTSHVDISHREHQLRALLHQLRITAKSVMVPWDHVICHLEPHPPNRNGSANSSSSSLLGGSSESGRPTSSSSILVAEEPPAVDVELEKLASSTSSTSALDFTVFPERYVQSMNETIKRNVATGNTAVVFLNLPPPPADEAHSLKYLEYLSVLSDGLPPTLLVHGISSVISTGL